MFKLTMVPQFIIFRLSLSLSLSLYLTLLIFSLLISKSPKPDKTSQNPQNFPSLSHTFPHFLTNQSQPPTMPKPHHHHPHPPPHPSGRTNLASCFVASIFLIFITIVILIVYFTVFKPSDPKISITAVQLPSFAILNNTVNFTFSQYAAVKNPNRAAFSHYDSSLQLLYSGNQVGFMFIPAGKIDAGRTQYMAATFAVQSFPLTPPGTGVEAVVPPGVVPPGVGGGGGFGGLPVGPTIEIESKMEMEGRVRVLRVFTHHVRAKAGCRVAIAVSDGSVLGFHC